MIKNQKDLDMNKIVSIIQLIILGLSAVFSFLHISFKLDISIFAFFISIIYTVIIFYFGFICLDKKKDVKKLSLVTKLYQYLPFLQIAVFIIRRAGADGCSLGFDIVCGLLWIISSGLTIYFAYCISKKRLDKYCPDLANKLNDLPENKPNIIKKVIFEILEWVDAFVQAAFTVTLINLFIFQLYAIPSESMVNEFLIKDRVVGVKIFSGAKLPLSDAGIPRIKNYDRGDIVIFRNPHYKNDRQGEIKNFLYQLVYMLTFTGVNLNVDEMGNPKADPLVKRVVGESGEQLMMQDGVLYSRTKNDSEFKPVTDDSKWAVWDCSSLPEAKNKKIDFIPLNDIQYKLLLDIEAERNALNLTEAANEARELSKRFKAVAGSKKTLSEDELKKLFNSEDLFAYNLFAESNKFCRSLLAVDGGSQWFEKFMCDWIQSIPSDNSLIGNNLYDDSNFRLNIMVKLIFGNLIVRDAELIQSGVLLSHIMRDPTRLSFIREAENIFMYVSLLDLRNMPIFPANDAEGNAVYIPEDNFFLMGDNRFNSLDMRHSYDQKLIPITKYDDYSVTYYSNISPQYVSADEILGTASLRFWPLNRFGVPNKNKGK